MKTCSRCGVNKKSKSFYEWKNAICKECHKENDKKRYKERKEYFKKYLKEYFKNPEKKKRHMQNSIKYASQWHENNKEKVICQQKLHYYIIKHKINKPEKCSCCFKQLKIEAHHPDYSEPLLVVWLCRSCHKQHHLHGIKIPKPINYSTS